MKTMQRNTATLALAIGLSTLAANLTAADAANETPIADAAQLPAGWTAADMQAMMEAATPGEMHKHLANDVGTWKCKTKMWMGPGTEPIESEGTSTAKSLMDGRYIYCDMKSEFPGMGPFSGIGIYGFDNVSKQFVATWLDNVGTGIMSGEGELSADGKTLTWKFKGNCPITKKQIVMREIVTTIDANTKKLEMIGPDPKTGKEFKTMEIMMTKK